jgi:D-glycero-alpha-D-manno-heptose-7-phosphate kinase
MIFRSKAPLRIGLAGGGTDVSPYSDQFGGSILNATINLYARTHIERTNDEMVSFHSIDQQKTIAFNKNEQIPIDNPLGLLTGVYRSIIEDYGDIRSGLKITTSVDVPAGSGLGTSSTLVVSMIGAFSEMMNIPFGEYKDGRWQTRPICCHIWRFQFHGILQR